MVIQINRHGDYDVLTSDCILQSPQNDLNIKYLLNEFSNEVLFNHDKGK